MADIADFANDLVQERIDQALAARRVGDAAGPSALWCEGCDESIPLARRLAVAGCTHCVSCQAWEEHKGAHHAR